MRHAGHQVDKTHRVADGGLLLGKRLVRLAISFVFHHPGRAVGIPVGGFTALFVLIIIEMRLFTALFDKVVHQRHVTWFLSHFVQAHQRQFNLWMSRVAVNLLLTGAEDLMDMVGQATYHLQQAALAGGLEEGHARFNHMPGAVKLMAFGQIGPALSWRLRREVGIEIAIFTLGRGNQLDNLIGGTFQLGIRLLAQRPCDGFQPFRHVAVLEHHAVKFSLLLPGGDAEILYRVARLSVVYPVIQRIPLIGDHYIAHQLLILGEERIVHFQRM